jgi:hypothetical protein
MKMRRERDAKRVAKSVRSHEATMAAYDRQIHTPLKYMDSNHWPEARTGDFRPVAPGDEMIVPGMGHVTTYHKNIAPSGRYRGIDLTRRGTAGIGDAKNTTAAYEDKVLKKDYAKNKAKKEKEKNNGN